MVYDLLGRLDRATGELKGSASSPIFILLAMNIAPYSELFVFSTARQDLRAGCFVDEQEAISHALR